MPNEEIAALRKQLSDLQKEHDSLRGLLSEPILFRQAIEVGGAGLWNLVWDIEPAKQKFSVSSRWGSVMGYTPKSYQNFLDHIHEDDMPHYLVFRGKILSHPPGQVHSCNIRVKIRNEFRWVRETAKRHDELIRDQVKDSIKDPGFGDKTDPIMSGTNVDEKEASKELGLSKETVRIVSGTHIDLSETTGAVDTLLDQIPCWVFVKKRRQKFVDSDPSPLTLTYVNQTFADDFDLDKSKIIGTTDNELFFHISEKQKSNPDNKNAPVKPPSEFAQDDNKVLQFKKEQVSEKGISTQIIHIEEIVNTNRGPLYLRTLKAPIYAPDAKVGDPPEGVLAIAVRHIDEHLIFDNSLLGKILDAFTEPVFVKGLNHKYLYANSAYKADIQLPFGESIVGKDEDHFGVFPKGYAEKARMTEEEIKDDGKPRRNIPVAPLGNQRRRLMTKAPIIINHSLMYYFSHIRDMTEPFDSESKKIIKWLTHDGGLDNLADARDLLSGLLVTPPSELATEVGGDRLLYQKIRKIRDKLQAGVRNFNAISRAYSDNECWKTESVCIQDLVATIVSDMAPRIGSRIQVKNQIPVEVIVPLDKLMFEYLLRNLIRNATTSIEARLTSESAGKLQGCITFSITLSESGFSFSIEDDGAGMTDVEFEVVGQILRYESEQIFSTSGGDGFGLRLVRNIVRMSGGKVTPIRKHPGIEFKIEIPTQQKSNK